MIEQNHTIQDIALDLLQRLITIPSYSKEEDKTASLIEETLSKYHVAPTRVGHNVFALNKHFDPNKPSLLFNSHHDTVKPNPQYSRDPFHPSIEGGRLFGLGSNDAGGCLVSLLAVFIYYFNNTNLKYNLVFAATAEEEISGTGGIEMILPLLPRIEAAIVGEPTQMQMAVAERGLLVLDCVANGKAGHAARNEGENAIYNAIEDINWFRNYTFPKVSTLLGSNKMNVTVIETDNKAHNVVPAQCHYVIDTRINELYTFEDVLAIIRANVKSLVTPRSTRLRSTSISLEHPLVKAGLSLGMTYYGSPTTSDKALMPFPALKLGPGDSARSHTADEYIYIHEIKDGIDLYIRLLNQLLI